MRTRAPTAVPVPVRYARSFAVGAGFAIGWTPCIGPILGAILVLAASSGTVVHGALLLGVWSAGLGVPFLIAGLALGHVMTGTKRVERFLPYIELFAGALVMLVGTLIFLDRFTIFNQYFAGGASTVTEAEGAIEGINVHGPFGFAAAFLAGIIAFISPCSLPLVPAYLGHLAGVSGDELGSGQRRGVTFRHSLAFVIGFSAVFVILGASLGVLGSLVRDNLSTIEKIAGVMLVVLGLNLAGAIRIPFLYRTYALRIGG